MDIDITELTAYEIQQILTNYPRGRLAIKHDRIFWDSGSLEPIPAPTGAVRNNIPPQPQGARGGDNIGQRFSRMADTLGSMVC